MHKSILTLSYIQLSAIYKGKHQLLHITSPDKRTIPKFRITKASTTDYRMIMSDLKSPINKTMSLPISKSLGIPMSRFRHSHITHFQPKLLWGNSCRELHTNGKPYGWKLFLQKPSINRNYFYVFHLNLQPHARRIWKGMWWKERITQKGPDPNFIWCDAET